jgi:DNA-binding MarR family transcriptional regulator
MSKPDIHEDIMTLAYQLMRQMRKNGDPSASHDRINPYQLHALHLLAQDKTTMGELADELNVTFPSATSLVDRLVKAGWVGRGFDPDDRRIIRLHLTREGKKILADCMKERKHKFQYILDAMSEKDVEALYRILGNLNTSLSERKQTKQGK